MRLVKPTAFTQLDTMETMVRTCEALDAIWSVAEQVPDMAVGAGTIVPPEQAREAVSAGAVLLVSPGCTPHLLEAMLDQAVPILPGAATASEAIALMERGVTEMKFFPAASTGGRRRFGHWRVRCPRPTNTSREFRPRSRSHRRTWPAEHTGLLE
jgi:Entner-Doudoroff aldolase